ncbi:MAG: ParB/RepB/Spo0J family partition protein [Phycisphaerales bacterium]|nr:ParB/RepB/Spo0J family partition protein [Phycisphaerales bacterium]
MSTRVSTRRKVPDGLRMIPLDRLVPTPDSRRRPITKASVESLARSLKSDGVIHPVLVRPHPSKKGQWEIRAGERRWRAAKLAGLKAIPAIVRELDDESALSVTIAENLQREDPHPLEEADTIQQAFERGYDIKAVAARLGKSPQYIARRASLTRLTTAWRDEILRPESEAGRLSVGHLELVARLPEETQDLLAADDFRSVFGRGFPTVEELRRVIDGGLQTLRAMPWPLDDDTLDLAAGSCLNCQKRSGMHPLLFDAEDAPEQGRVSKTDRCLDPACFERKQTAHVLRCEAKLRQEHPNLRLVQIGFGSLTPKAREAFGERVTRVYHPQAVKPSHPGAVAAMQVDGPKAGRLVHLDLGDSVTDNGAARPKRPRTADGKPVPMSLSERKAKLQKRRDAYLVHRVTEKLRELTPEALVKTAWQIVYRRETDEEAKRFDPLALLLAFGTSSRADHASDGEAWDRYKGVIDAPAENQIGAALAEVVQVWLRRLGGSDTRFVTQQAQDARRICRILGFELKAIEDEAASAIPTPKSWASLPDDDDTSEPPFDVTPQHDAKLNGHTPTPRKATKKKTSKKRPRRRGR